MATSTGKIQYIKDPDTNGIVLPVTHERGVVDSSGVNLQTKLAQKIGSDDIDNVVELTQTQYDALQSKDSRTMYIISDSTVPSDHVGVAKIEQTTTSTADGGTNVITCTLTNDVTTTFQIKNGNQGNSGYSGAAGELEVVNNLTDGGATAALSAEMGKTLEGEISQLGLEVDEKISITDAGGAGNIEDLRNLPVDQQTTSGIVDETIKVTDNSGAVTYVEITPNGIKAKGYYDLNGNRVIPEMTDDLQLVPMATTPGTYIGTTNIGYTINLQTHQSFILYKFNVASYNSCEWTSAINLDSGLYLWFGTDASDKVVRYGPKSDVTSDWMKSGTADLTGCTYLYINCKTGNDASAYIPESVSLDAALSETYNFSKSIDKHGKIGLFLGDSIMQGAGSVVGANTVFYIQDYLYGTFYNLGIGATRFKNLSGTSGNMLDVVNGLLNNNWTAVDSVLNSQTQTPIVLNTKATYTELKTFIAAGGMKEVDFIFIAYGFNDWKDGMAFDNDQNEYDTSTPCGALREAVKEILEAYPKIKIYVAAPGYAVWEYDSEGDIIDDSDTKLFGGHNLGELADAIAGCCKGLHIPCYNQYWLNNVDKYNWHEYLSDGVHRSMAGCKLHAEQYAKFIMSV